MGIHQKNRNTQKAWSAAFWTLKCFQLLNKNIFKQNGGKMGTDSNSICVNKKMNNSRGSNWLSVGQSEKMRHSRFWAAGSQASESKDLQAARSPGKRRSMTRAGVGGDAGSWGGVMWAAQQDTDSRHTRISPGADS